MRAVLGQNLPLFLLSPFYRCCITLGMPYWGLFAWKLVLNTQMKIFVRSFGVHTFTTPRLEHTNLGVTLRKNWTHHSKFARRTSCGVICKHGILFRTYWDVLLGKLSIGTRTSTTSTINEVRVSKINTSTIRDVDYVIGWKVHFCVFGFTTRNNANTGSLS